MYLYTHVILCAALISNPTDASPHERMEAADREAVEIVDGPHTVSAEPESVEGQVTDCKFSKAGWGTDLIFICFG